MPTLEEILGSLHKAGLGAKKKDAPVKAKKEAPTPTKGNGKKKAPAPTPVKGDGRHNLKPGEPSNLEKYGEEVDAGVVKAIKKAEMEVGWIRITKAGDVIFMPDTDPEGRKSGLAYRG